MEKRLRTEIQSMEIEKTQTMTEAEQTQSTMPSLSGKICKRETNDKKFSLKGEWFEIKEIEKTIIPIANAPIEESRLYSYHTLLKDLPFEKWLIYVMINVVGILSDSCKRCLEKAMKRSEQLQ